MLNQILSVENVKQKKKKHKSSGGEPIETKKIVMVFAIIILLFGISVISSASFSMYKNIQTAKAPTQPLIEISHISESQAQIKASFNAGIEKVVYRWDNDTDSITISGNGESVVTKTISIPSDKTMLNVYAESINGQSITETEDFSNGININFEQEENAQINIIIDSTTELSYMVVSWDNVAGEPIQLENSNAKQAVDVPEGAHTLTVKVVDVNNKTREITKQVITKPKLEVTRNDQNKLVIKASDESGIKTVEFTVNGSDEYLIHYDQVFEQNQRKEIEYSGFSLPEENTQVTVKVYNENNVESEKTLTV